METLEYLLGVAGKVIFYNMLVGFMSLVYDAFAEKQTGMICLFMTTVIILISELAYQFYKYKKEENED